MTNTYQREVFRDDAGFVIRSLAADTKLVIGPEDAILHVDIQTAFMTDHVRDGKTISGGGLGVPGGHCVVDVALRNSSFFTDGQRYFSLDRHPEGHVGDVNSYEGLAPFTDLTVDMVTAWPDGSRIVSPHFDREYLLRYLASTPTHRQTLWPKHARRGTAETERHPAMRHLTCMRTLVKGQDPRVDSYSPFQDNIGRSTGLGQEMRADGVKRLFIDGLAYNVCVGHAAIDAYLLFGFETFVIKDATRSVQIPGLEVQMDNDLGLCPGVHIITSDMLASA